MSEPVIIGLAPALITALIGALAKAANAFGWAITPEQLDAILGIVVPLMTVLAVVGAWWARRRVTPVAAPTLPQGTTVKVVTPPGEANTTTTL